ncbi:MAG: hypothetical protein IPK16_22590 [Anaerolineales bacterium]|nr:hypothetical protein [Anaerolineales bacterium]
MSFDLTEGEETITLPSRFLTLDPEEPLYTPAPKVKAKSKPSQKQRVAQVTETAKAATDELDITYTPARYETIWLRDSLQTFFVQAMIDDVLALVKGGKEANVYMCQAAYRADVPLVAAKVYRPRQFRNLRNDATYREGREMIGPQGGTIKNRNNREMRAIGKKTTFGAELTHISWLMHEFLTLKRLYDIGAAVPKPLVAGENAILMEFIGDRGRPAPVLHSVTLPRPEAARHFDEVLHNVELMLCRGMIHGDLSAYNILYWEKKVTLIDFPQVTLSETNHAAFRILERDIRRVCEYFALQCVVHDGPDIARSLWQRCVGLPETRTIQDAV